MLFLAQKLLANFRIKNPRLFGFKNIIFGFITESYILYNHGKRFYTCFKGLMFGIDAFMLM